MFCMALNSDSNLPSRSSTSKAVKPIALESLVKYTGCLVGDGKGAALDPASFFKDHSTLEACCCMSLTDGVLGTTKFPRMLPPNAEPLFAAASPRALGVWLLTVGRRRTGVIGPSPVMVTRSRAEPPIAGSLSLSESDDSCRDKDTSLSGKRGTLYSVDKSCCERHLRVWLTGNALQSIFFRTRGCGWAVPCFLFSSLSSSRTLIEVKGRALPLEVPDRTLAERVWYDVWEDRDGGRLPPPILLP